MVDDVMGGTKAQSLRRDVDMSMHVLYTVSEAVRFLAYGFGYILSQSSISPRGTNSNGMNKRSKWTTFLRDEMTLVPVII